MKIFHGYITTTPHNLASQFMGVATPKQLRRPKRYIGYLREGSIIH